MLRRQARAMPPSESGTRGGGSLPTMSVDAGAGLSASFSGDTLSIFLTRPAPIWAIITGQASATNRYAWTQINDADITGTFSANLSTYFAASGTSDEAGRCAYEINGSKSVPTGAKVLMRPGGDGSFWVFSYLGATVESTSAALATGAWVAGLTSADCLRLTVVSATGACSAIDAEQDIALAWDAVDSRWESTATAFTGTGSGGTGQVVFGRTNGVPYMQIDSVYGTYLGGDGGGGLLFAFGGAVLCGGSAGECNNAFTVRIACDCCPIAGWDGAGWYCVLDEGGEDCETDDRVAVELLEADRCDDTITICSGPYATEEEADAACPTTPVANACCPGGAAPVLDVTIGGAVGAGVYVVTYDAAGANGVGWYSPTTPVGGDNVYYRWWCSAGTWLLDQYCNGSPTGTGSGGTLNSCSPFSYTGGTGAFGGVCSDLSPSFSVAE